MPTTSAMATSTMVTRGSPIHAARSLDAVVKAAVQTAGLDVVDQIVLACLLGVGYTAIATAPSTSGRGAGYLKAAAQALDEHRATPHANPRTVALIDALLAVCYALTGERGERMARHLARADRQVDSLPDTAVLLPRALLAVASAVAVKERA